MPLLFHILIVVGCFVTGSVLSTLTQHNEPVFRPSPFNTGVQLTFFDLWMFTDHRQHFNPKFPETWKTCQCYLSVAQVEFALLMRRDELNVSLATTREGVHTIAPRMRGYYFQ